MCERLERERDAGPELGPGGVHRRAPSRRTSSSPLVNGLSIRGVELSSLAPAEAWNELVLIFEASSRLLDPARGSRRSWGGAIRRAAWNTEWLRSERGASRLDSRSETPTCGGECGARHSQSQICLYQTLDKLARKDVRVQACWRPGATDAAGIARNFEDT